MMKQSMILILVASVTVLASSRAFLPNITDPEYDRLLNPVQEIIVGDNKILSIEFPDVNYEISKAYATNTQQFSAMTLSSSEQQIYNRSIYDNKAKDSCILYSSDMYVQLNSSISLTDSILFYQVYKGSIYVITSRSLFNIYQFGSEGLDMKQQITLSEDILLLEDGVPFYDMQLLVIQDEVFILSNSNIWRLVSEQFKKVNKEDEAFHVQKIGLVKDDILWVYYLDQIITYTVVKTQTQVSFEKNTTFNVNLSETVSDIEYDSSDQLFYVLGPNKLVILDLANTTSRIQYQIDGEECSSVTKIKSTLYIACEVERINFIVELHVAKKGEQIMINRFYDDGLVEGIRKAETLSYDKIALIGDEVVLVLGEAVNRNFLLQQILKNGQIQNSEQFYSFNLLDIYPLISYSDKNNEVILVISLDSLEIYSVVRNPAELQCYFDRTEVGASVSVLVAFNTTHCDDGADSPLSGTESVCETFYLYEVYVGAREFEHKTAKLIMLFATLLIGIFSIVCIGCGVKIRNTLNIAINKVKSKIRKLKETNNQMKQI